MATAAQMSFNFSGVVTIGSAFAIAMLGAIESLLSAVVADGMGGTRHDSNQELIGQGIVNVLAPLAGARAPGSTRGNPVRRGMERERGAAFLSHGGRRAAALPPDVLVYRVEGPFFFGAVENFERALAGTHTDLRVLIIRLRWVPFMDITGLQTLEEVIRDLQRRRVRVMLTGANERVRGELEKAGIIDLIGRENFCENMQQALSVFGP